jgi:hypothetical protein
VCSLKKSAAMRMLKRGEEPFKTLGMDDLFPTKPIFNKQRELKQPYRSCAVIASAGSLVDSQLGNFIGTSSRDVIYQLMQLSICFSSQILTMSLYGSITHRRLALKMMLERKQQSGLLTRK